MHVVRQTVKMSLIQSKDNVEYSPVMLRAAGRAARRGLKFSGEVAKGTLEDALKKAAKKPKMKFPNSGAASISGGSRRAAIAERRQEARQKLLMEAQQRAEEEKKDEEARIIKQLEDTMKQRRMQENSKKLKELMRL